MSARPSPQIPLPPGAPAALSGQPGGLAIELREWRAAIRGLPDNPLAHAFALTRRRRLAGIPRLRRYGAPLAVFMLLAALLIVIYIDEGMGGGGPRPSEWPWVLLLMLGLPMYGVWLLRSVYEVALLSLQLLGATTRRAAHLQIDDMLALTPLTTKEIVAGTVWTVVRPLLPVALGGAGLLWLVGLGITLEMGGSYSGDSALTFIVLAFAPVTVASVALCSLATLSTLSLWWIALGRGLKADQLSVGGALVYGLLQALSAPMWMFLSFELRSSYTGDAGYGELGEQLLLFVIAAALLLGTVWLLVRGTERMPTIRAGLAAVGPLLPAILGFAFCGALLSALEVNPSYLLFDHDVLDAFMPNVVLSWGALLPVNPLAVPHPLLLGMVPLEAEFELLWPTPLHFALLLALQAALLWTCAAAALRSVELRRRAL